ncbi:peptide deformylase [Rhodobacteraceae bacterium NNCM2]|nr:peptide deformylase [Coraliihabitans acroporae]
MPRAFVPWPDPRLKAVARPVEAVDDEVRAIWREMLDAMYAMPGVGLAAPQLGIGLRLAVVDCREGGEVARLANPRILWASDTMVPYTEASPNIPGLAVEVSRPDAVRVAYLDDEGAERERLFEGLWATSVQHQIDHLDGKMFIDRLSPIKRRRALDRYRKELKRKRRA